MNITFYSFEFENKATGKVNIKFVIRKPIRDWCEAKECDVNHGHMDMDTWQ